MMYNPVVKILMPLPPPPPPLPLNTHTQPIQSQAHTLYFHTHARPHHYKNPAYKKYPNLTYFTHARRRKLACLTSNNIPTAASQRIFFQPASAAFLSHLLFFVSLAIFLQGSMDGFCGVLALGGTAGACELLPFDDPELLSVVKPTHHRYRCQSNSEPFFNSSYLFHVIFICAHSSLQHFKYLPTNTYFVNAAKGDIRSLTLFIPSNFRGINLSGPSNFQCWGRKTGAPTK